MRLTGKRQIAVIAGLVALAFSAGLAQSGFARVNELPTAFGTAAGSIERELSVFMQRGPFGKGDYVAAAAAYIGITEAQVRTELQAGKSLAEIAVANGKTRDGLIAALADVSREKIGTLVDQKGPFGPGPGRPGKAIHVGVEIFNVASTYLGIEREALLTRVRAGETLGEVANATAGKSRDGLVDAIVAASNAKVDEALANGRITAEQATKMKAAQEEVAERIVDADAPFNKGDLRKGGPLLPRRP